MADTPAPPAPADCGEQLKQLFPALFGAAPKPIKLRIQTDIQERAPGVFTRQALSAFFRRYTLSTPYLLALTKATHRFDLDGAPAGELSEEHRQAARDELARRRARHEEKRRIEREQRRERAALLRDFERTTLAPANFCALKGLDPDALDALLAQARQEAEEDRKAAAAARAAGADDPRRRPPRPGRDRAPQRR